MQRWIAHPLTFAFVVLSGTGVIVAWALGGFDVAKAVAAIIILSVAACVRALLNLRRLYRWYQRRRPVKPEDRDRRREEREVRRRARAGADSRYGAVARD